MAAPPAPGAGVNPLTVIKLGLAGIKTAVSLASGAKDILGVQQELTKIVSRVRRQLSATENYYETVGHHLPDTLYAAPFSSSRPASMFCSAFFLSFGVTSFSVAAA